jgi:hypothetical protein
VAHAKNALAQAVSSRLFPFARLSLAKFASDNRRDAADMKIVSHFPNQPDPEIPP